MQQQSQPRAAVLRGQPHPGAHFPGSAALARKSAEIGREIPNKKVCGHCRQTKDWREFEIVPEHEDGLAVNCKACPEAGKVVTVPAAGADDESQAKAAYACYQALGPEATLDAVAAYGTWELTQLQQWAERYRWTKPEAVVMKTCGICGIEQPLSAFPTHPKGTQGRGPYDEACNKKLAAVQWWLKAAWQGTIENAPKPVELARKLPETKTCASCGQQHPWKAFAFDATTEDHLAPLCRTCRDAGKTVAAPVAGQPAPAQPAVVVAPQVKLAANVKVAGEVFNMAQAPTFQLPMLGAGGWFFHPDRMLGIHQTAPDAFEVLLAMETTRPDGTRGPLAMPYEGAAAQALLALLSGAQPEALIRELNAVKGELEAAIELSAATEGEKNEVVGKLTEAQAEIERLRADTTSKTALDAAQQELRTAKAFIEAQAKEIERLNDELERKERELKAARQELGTLERLDTAPLAKVVARLNALTMPGK